MSKNTDIRAGRHCVFEIHAHLVFVTKYRGRVFSDAHLKTLERVLCKVCHDFEADLVEFNGEADHVHLLVTYPPKIALSRLVNSLKGASSRRMKQMYPELAAPAYQHNALWSPSYFAGSVGGAPLSVVKAYIEQQTRPL
ncbi:IS200/IS605 family transposase (plasmid) [Pseudomonas luteola]|uniref:IS200/IS605 family transposase n=1 Tax=Pseudomonas TaxID=286 RepID=UPI000EFAB9F3|nr:IS200/IS605 family transposase [Pseudomonas sp. LTJR-52]AYN96807.1 IS200/IS605 family transposase [Pseudomonas sp. LTJR-52]